MDFDSDVAVKALQSRLACNLHMALGTFASSERHDRPCCLNAPGMFFLC